MYPDLTSDDIFRIETERLWLRWPRASDAAAITGFASLAQVARMTAAIPHPYPPGEAEQFILKARADNARGAALILAICQKTGARRTIGLISAVPVAAHDLELGYILAPSVWGQGYASEAARALADAVFCLTRARRIVASSRSGNLASRRVLEKSGFSFVETCLDLLPARGGLHPCDHFELDRKQWMADRRRRGGLRALPPMAQQARDESTASGRAFAIEQVEG
jgi:RimJ/RimL family protein N-acetyltransferase